MDSNAIGTNPQKPNKSSLHSPIPGVILNLRRLLEGCPAWWACTCRGPGLVARVATHTASKTRTSPFAHHACSIIASVTAISSHRCSAPLNSSLIITRITDYRITDYKREWLPSYLLMLMSDSSRVVSYIMMWLRL